MSTGVQQLLAQQRLVQRLPAQQVLLAQHLLPAQARNRPGPARPGRRQRRY